MNNFTFGNERHQYYETIAGGAGAGPDFDGASAVQTHMTNSRLTDPGGARDPLSGAGRALRHPPRLGRGGAAQRRRRSRAPHPLPRADAAPTSSPTAARCRRAGSRAAATPKPGVNQVIRADGTVETLTRDRLGRDAAGDMFVIENSGGRGLWTCPLTEEKSSPAFQGRGTRRSVVEGPLRRRQYPSTPLRAVPLPEIAGRNFA